MIVPITGNVTYTITMDPTVWIFDDRKVLLKEAFDNKVATHNTEEEKLKRAAQRLDKELYHHENIKPPINKSLSKFEREQALKNSYVMPIKDFLDHAEVKGDASKATLVTNHDDVEISLTDLQSCYLLFAIDGKPVKDNGPIHLMFSDGSNKDNPIKGIHKIIIR